MILILITGSDRLSNKHVNKTSFRIVLKPIIIFIHFFNLTYNKIFSSIVSFATGLQARAHLPVTACWRRLVWEYDVRVPVAGSLYTPRAQERGRCPSPVHLLKDWMDPGVYGHGITRHLSHTTNCLSTTFLLYFMAVTDNMLPPLSMRFRGV